MPKATKIVAETGTPTAPSSQKGRKRPRADLVAMWVRAQRELVRLEARVRESVAVPQELDDALDEIVDAVSAIEWQAAETPPVDLAGAVMRIRVAERRLSEEWMSRPDPHDAATEMAIDLLRAALVFFGPDEGAVAMRAGMGAWLVQKTGGGWDPRFGGNHSRRAPASVTISAPRAASPSAGVPGR